MAAHLARGPRVRRWVALGLLLTVAESAQPVQPGASGSSNPCSNKRGHVETIKADFRAGQNPRDLRTFKGEASFTPTGQAETDRRRREETRMAAFEAAWRELSRLQGLTFDKARARYAEAFASYVRTGDQGILRHDVRPLLEVETQDYTRCTTSYAITLAVHLVPRLEALDAPLRAALDSALQDVRPHGDTVVINLGQLLQRLRHDELFVNAVRQEWENTARREILLYKDDDTQAFLESVALRKVEILNYAKGQYRPSALLAAIITRAVGPMVRRFLREYRDVGVLCSGSADGLPITKGIPYSGQGRCSSAGASLKLASSSGASLEPLLKSNLELSCARAHEALVALANGIERPERLTLRYVGSGALVGHDVDDPLSRKITFEVRGQGRYE
jgi:hypothetical protein